MSYLEELLPAFRKGAKIRQSDWEDGSYIYLKNGKINDTSKSQVVWSLNGCSDWFSSNEWELYQEPIDWEYIIKNKCLCWFWDDDEVNRKIGIVTKVESEYTRVPYFNQNIGWYKHCYPVYRDEVTFYEDREDDLR